MSEDFKNKAKEEGVPIITDEGLAFLLNYIEEHHCKDILELGTAVAYSAIQMAKLDEGIVIDTIERKEDMYRQAVRNIRDAGLEERIHAHFMPIEEFHTDRKYDLIFVDAAKAQYGRYTEEFLDNLKEDGAMIYDNMCFHGLVKDYESIPKRSLRGLARKIARFSEMVHNDDRFDIMEFDDVGDGILVLTRRKSGT